MQSTHSQLSKEHLTRLSHTQLVDFAEAEHLLRLQMQDQLEGQQSLTKELQDGIAHIGGILVKFKNKLFGKSSEKSRAGARKDRKRSKERTPTSKLPSERYSNAEVIERDVELSSMPTCTCCGHEMADSGMTEVSEYIQVIPKKFVIVRQIRHKYRCGGCHSEIKTAPSLERIKPGSTYGDEMIIDIAMSKYCDLIPIERYRAMAEREGFAGLPANSLIEATHHLADFVTPAVERVKSEVLSLNVLMADETPHRMLEGDKKSNWYLWGFSGPEACYFECHDTRSGDIASNFLEYSSCETLLSDVYSGYAKAVRVANEGRKENEKPEIKKAYCNAHARRKFKESGDEENEDVEFYVGKYREIYLLEAQCKDKEHEDILAIRAEMKPHFEKIHEQALMTLEAYSSKSEMAKAAKYFLKNYEGLTRFLTNSAIPIDNNAQERNLRSPVVGRKTWYGTHSKRGAETSSKLFTLVESCKLNKINPRKYFQALTSEMLTGKPPFSPAEFKRRE